MVSKVDLQLQSLKHHILCIYYYSIMIEIDHDDVSLKVLRKIIQ